jgi:hypothetical protein
MEVFVQDKMKGYKMKDKGTEVQIPLLSLETVEPLIARAKKQEISAILCKVIDDTDLDRCKGKQLAQKILSKNYSFSTDVK